MLDSYPSEQSTPSANRTSRDIRPDYGLGSHIAALGVSFSSSAMGYKVGHGGFLGEHGSWNGIPSVGYKVIFRAVLSGDNRLIGGSQSRDGIRRSND